MVGKAFPLLSGSAWKRMHIDKAEICSSHFFSVKQYTFHDQRSYDPPFCIACSIESSSNHQLNDCLVPAKSNSYYQDFNVKSLFGEIGCPKKSQVKLKVVTAASDTITAASTTITAADVPILVAAHTLTTTPSAARRRKGVIVPNDEDDACTEATPLDRKAPVVDYEIYKENNKPYYKIKRADGSHQLYLSFLSLLRNFDREDLGTLWRLVKDRFATTKPKNFSDDFLLITLGAMFEKPDIQAQI
nr:hypothetical protein [Tanacetum cinerariifolium]